jgi:CRISPR-associated endoribonuclease Cas6
MRSIIQIKALEDEARDKQYYFKIQGLLYSLLKNSQFFKLHDKSSYKFFCFSNIFPLENFIKNKSYKFIISSPSVEFIELLNRKLKEMGQITVGKCVFCVENFQLLRPKLKFPLTIQTVTPIIIRIPKKNYGHYGIKSPKPYPYLYWRPNYSFEAFIGQLEANIFKKYREYFPTENIAEEFPIFQRFLFKKSVAIPLEIHNQRAQFIGSLWNFYFDQLSSQTAKILEFSLDCGFGENNSKGFGFINIEKKTYA